MADGIVWQYSHHFPKWKSLDEVSDYRHSAGAVIESNAIKKSGKQGLPGKESVIHRHEMGSVAADDGVNYRSMVDLCKCGILSHSASQTKAGRELLTAGMMQRGAVVYASVAWRHSSALRQD